MTFRPRNAYYLRISTNIVLPLFLYLDERHIDWMSDVALQHILADLRPLIIPKLQAEKDVHFGPGAAPGSKRGTVEVHRGETYQFAYFFRRTEPHTVLFKSRYFLTAPPRPEVVARQPSTRQMKKSRAQVPVKRSKRKRATANSKGKGKSSHNHPDEDEWFNEESEEDMDDADPIPRELRPIRKQRRIVTDAYQEDDDDSVEDMYEDVAMSTPPSEMAGEFSENPDIPIAEDQDVAICDANNQPSDAADIDLVVEEEEPKPKPLLKLTYQSFPISGHCLCVVVEPWPPLRAEAKQSPIGQGTPPQRGRVEPSLVLSNVSVIAGQRAKTPLFLPEYDRAPSEAPFAREKTVPPVPLFHDALSETEGDTDGHLMNFSQALNAAGHMHTVAADDDDDMDGAVLFGDADEVRELF